MTDCYHFTLAKDDDDNTYCTKCGEYFVVTPETSVTITLKGDGQYENNGATVQKYNGDEVNLLTILQSLLGIPRIHIQDVILNRAGYETVFTALFSVGNDTQYISADVITRVWEHKEGTGRFYTAPELSENTAN